MGSKKTSSPLIKDMCKVIYKNFYSLANHTDSEEKWLTSGLLKWFPAY